MKSYIALSFILPMLVCCSCSPPPDTLIEGGYDQQEMDEAIARARAEVDAFIDQLSKGNGENFSVKAPIQDAGETEHFWLTDVVYRDGEFEGISGTSQEGYAMSSLVRNGRSRRMSISPNRHPRGGNTRISKGVVEPQPPSLPGAS